MFSLFTIIHYQHYIMIIAYLTNFMDFFWDIKSQ